MIPLAAGRRVCLGECADCNLFKKCSYKMFHHKSEGLHPSVKLMYTALYYLHVKKKWFFFFPRVDGVMSAASLGMFLDHSSAWKESGFGTDVGIKWSRCEDICLGKDCNSYVWQAFVLSAALSKFKRLLFQVSSSTLICSMLGMWRHL